ncbi:hypothetical protein QWY77_14560 [Thalassotalea ponticola]|uniref:hypothetical protein n=1 Tax=Thalassotalea ponticola TaxID=1523392 RepID=UPI0025B3BC99|nr:hypothetical protein [Thalassotalea ponticola]MDN3653960.1 hypothetical protein [Thalassotalea ponticola]
MKKLHQPQRRRVLKLLGVVSATGVVIPTVAVPKADDTTRDDKQTSSGYRETAHIRQFYQTLRD